MDHAQMDGVVRISDLHMEAKMFALGGNILVVDEGAGFCRNLAAKLASRGYRADFSFNVPSAASRLAEGEIDLVVMSCAGESPCLQMIEQVKTLCLDIPVLAFEAPECGRKCICPSATQDVRIVGLGSWDIEEASKHVYECLEEVLKKAGSATIGSQLLFGLGKQVDVQILGMSRTGNMTSTIMQRDDRYLYLSPIKDSSNRICEVPLRASIRVGVAGKDAHYSFTSQVVDIIQEPVFMLQMGKPVVIYRTQRRKHPRFPMKLPIRMAAYCDESETDPIRIEGSTDDISRGGMRITIPEYVEPGEVIMVDVEGKPKTESVTGLAYVLRTVPNPSEQEGGYILSCRFSRIDDSIDTLLHTEQ